MGLDRRHLVEVEVALDQHFLERPAARRRDRAIACVSAVLCCEELRELLDRRPAGRVRPRAPAPRRTRPGCRSAPRRCGRRPGRASPARGAGGCGCSPTAPPSRSPRRTCRFHRRAPSSSTTTTAKVARQADAPAHRRGDLVGAEHRTLTPRVALVGQRAPASSANTGGATRGGQRGTDQHACRAPAPRRRRSFRRRPRPVSTAHGSSPTRRGTPAPPSRRTLSTHRRRQVKYTSM